MAHIYSTNENIYNLWINEYLIMRDKNNNIVDTLRWTKDGYQHLNYSPFSSK